MNEPVLAVDLGGTNVRCAVVDADGSVRHRRQRRTVPEHGVVPVPSTVIELVDEVRADERRADGAQLRVAVVGLPGVVDYRAQRLEAGPNLPQDWVPHLTADWLGEQLGCAVELANDADLAAVGESWFGAGKNYVDVAYVTISTGVGAGAVLGGRLVHGRRSGLELGHTVIDRRLAAEGHDGTVEGLGSGTALAARAEADFGHPVPGPELAEHVRMARTAPGQDDSGNLAQDVWKDVIGAAGLGIVNLCWTLSPEVVVVGGGVGLNWDLNEPILRDVLDRLGPPFEDIDLAPAALGDDAGLAGAAVWQQAIGRPTPLRDERSGEPGPSRA